jgi:UDP-glucose 4-epimerase
MILVTGATGYLGSHMVLKLIQERNSVLMVDDLSNSRGDVTTALHNEAVSYDGKWTVPVFKRLDLCNRDAVDRLFHSYDIDTVYHFAGLKSVAESKVRPTNYYRNNLIATMNLLEFGGRKIKKFIFSSSAAVYEPQDLWESCREDTNLRPITPYGRSKLMCEQMIEDYADTNPAFRYAILRYFNPAGCEPTGCLGENPKTVNNLMPILAEVALGLSRNHVNVYGTDYNTPDGTAIRDYVHVCDLIDGHVLASEILDEEQSTVLNLGTGKGVSVQELITTYQAVSSKPINVELKERRAGDAPFLVANITRAKSYGFNPQYTVHDMCRTSWKWAAGLH